MAETDCTVGELIKMLKAFPEDKPVKIFAWYSICETDEPEEVSSVCYLNEIDEFGDCVREITDFVAIVSDKYHEIAKGYP